MSKVRKSVERAAHIDWRGSEDRRLLRAAARFLREALETHLYAHVALLSPASGFSARKEADRLFDLLLEIDAIDLIGIACLIRSGETKAIGAKRRARARKAPRSATAAVH